MNQNEMIPETAHAQTASHVKGKMKKKKRTPRLGPGRPPLIDSLGFIPHPPLRLRPPRPPRPRLRL
jgi:hypothetical protein